MHLLTKLELLERIIFHHKYLYYHDGCPIVSDSDFDKLFKALPLDSKARMVGYRQPEGVERIVWFSREGRESLIQATRKMLKYLEDGLANFNRS